MKKISNFAFLVISAISITACSNGASALVPYNDTLDGTHDKRVIGKNELALSIGDPGAIWVSKEQDPIYGGYAYVAVTDLNYSPSDARYSKLAFSIYRSENLYDWEVCGALDGYALGIINEEDSWIDGLTWAPEMIFDKATQKYFMYFSARSYMGGGGKSYGPYTGTYDRMYAAIAMSDTPVGPFDVVTSETYYSLLGTKDLQRKAVIDQNGDEITKLNDQGQILNRNGDLITRNDPPINFQSKTASKYIDIPVKNDENCWPVLDSSLFIDEDGEIYLYFASGVSTYKSLYGDDYNRNEIWGMHMFDLMTPDYSSLSMLTTPNYRTCMATKNAGGKINLDPTSHVRTNYFGELNGSYSTVNEAPHMIKHNGTYYLTFAPCGTGNIRYSIAQAVSSNPLGQFTKLPEFNPVIGLNDNNDYLCGTGHHCFLTVGEEIYAFYHCFSYETTPSEDERCLAINKISFAQFDGYGYDIMVGSGPTLGYNPVPNEITGYQNIAKTATFDTNGNKDTVKYLTDDLVTVQEWTWNKEFKSNGDLKLTLTWDKPQFVRSLLIYNSSSFYTAFKSIDLITFHLLETPKWSSTPVEYGVIKNLAFNPWFANENNLSMRPGGAAIATFTEMKIDKIEINISSKFILENEDGSNTNFKDINISELFVMGKEAK